MRLGETMCYYRARGGQKSVYITIVYENDTLRESIIQYHEQQVIDEKDEKKEKDYQLSYPSIVLN
ncbi:hypothetical protein [Cellulosilyticum ruminicola]|uniref:hypothetical protein n=1 Tax=Cellulosilyticum ruminicola TaxID=425254 RepID=UPI0006CF351E|nr:hypothetical protein [Cellulosilyticum ruminicola]